MRTTIRLDDRLLRDAKKLALETGRTLTALIEDALREALSRRKTERRHGSLKLRTFRGKGVLPGVDLDDSAALRQVMEGADASP